VNVIKYRGSWIEQLFGLGYADFLPSRLRPCGTCLRPQIVFAAPDEAQDVRGTTRVNSEVPIDFG
jgi:hypothetical protein